MDQSQWAELAPGRPFCHLSPTPCQPPSDGPDELEQIRKIVLAICDEPEDDAPYVIVGEDGTPIVEADTLPEAIEQIIACWNAVELRLDRVGPSDGMPSEPSEEAIAAAMSFADGDAASHTSIRGSDYSRKEWTRLFLAAAYAAERGVSAVPPNHEGVDHETRSDLPGRDGASIQG